MLEAATLADSESTGREAGTECRLDGGLWLRRTIIIYLPIGASVVHSGLILENDRFSFWV